MMLKKVTECHEALTTSHTKTLQTNKKLDKGGKKGKEETMESKYKSK